MPRYIDADKVIEKIVNTPSMLPYEYDFDEKVLSLLAQRQNEILDIVEMNVPTENVAPVVHAHWEYRYDTGIYQTEFLCSRCKELIETYSCTVDEVEYEYCPHCGAKMDEVTEWTVTVHLITGEHIPCRNITEFHLHVDRFTLRGAKVGDYYEFDRRKMIGFDVALNESKEVGKCQDI